jgi:hypothetical protein
VSLRSVFSIYINNVSKIFNLAKSNRLIISTLKKGVMELSQFRILDLEFRIEKQKQ